MYPVDWGTHGFLGVQLAALVHVGLALAATVGLWALGLPADLSVPAFLVCLIALAKFFWPYYAALHPRQDER